MKKYFSLILLLFSNIFVFGQAIEVDSSGSVGVNMLPDIWSKFSIKGNTTGHYYSALIYGGDTSSAVYKATILLQNNTDTSVVTGTGVSLGFAPLSNTGGAYFGLAKISGIRENNTSNNQDTALTFQTRTGSSNSTIDTEKMRISANGNVGIGTTNPTSKLRVNLDDTGTKYVAICHSAAIGAHIYGANTTSQLRLTYPSVTDWDFLVNSAGALSLSSNSSERLKITTNGDITTTGGNFGVDSSGVPTYKITAESGYIGAKSGGLLGYGTSGNQLIVGYDSANRLLINVGSAGDQTWSMSGANAKLNLTGGNVGIGVIPTAKLDVAGNAVFTTAQTSGNALTINVDAPSGTPTGLRVAAGISTIGATAPLALIVDSAGSNLLRVQANGNIGMGTSAPTEKLEVNGAVKATSFKVGSTTLNVPDYVFEDNYELKSLEEVHAFIEKNGHLPGISSAKEINANGLDLPEMQLKLLEKVEELTLYSIKQNQEIQKLKKEKDELLETLLKRIENLEKNK